MQFLDTNLKKKKSNILYAENNKILMKFFKKQIKLRDNSYSCIGRFKCQYSLIPTRIVWGNLPEFTLW